MATEQDPPHPSQSDFDDLEREVRTLRVDLRKATKKYDDVKRRVELLDDGRLEEVTAGLVGLREEFEKISAALVVARNDTEDLKLRVDFIEQAVRSTDGAPVADLDDSDHFTRNLIGIIRRGDEARAAVLDESDRAHHVQVVERHRSLGDQYVRRRSEAVRHSAVLADVPLGGAPHGEAADAFRQAVLDTDTLARQLEQVRQEAAAASALIAADDDQQAVHGSAITGGDEARARLCQLLRRRVAAAVSESALLPKWLTIALGYGPPSGLKGGGWLDTAASLAAYRITYGVTDLVDALGTPPRESQRGPYAWYDELRAQLRTYQR
ncbi:hypothetical protein Ga0074812_112112 [Parafrankia irregularis]|uniref:Uncharacterized protein n=1 Tax=Parafrankia irregularis TaxID=795642 RepID=A0A0S4QRI9_9ACTN|nr:MULTISPECIES: hypothetical protein [Parafrankia]MBE3201707.1 hypothetical protein [Parafrankia sp. CH37]CUU57452.1 hypothetical protein Ga0074812_112112 [Parafrankia irregularis]